MKIVPFLKEHAEAAQALALQNYNEERESVPILPAFEAVSALDEFAENGIGVAALEGGKFVGFLCGCDPWQGGIGAGKDVLCTFSPIHAHGSVKENRARIYQNLYAAAAEQWVRNGILMHGVALYAHDEDAVRAFFEYGFGKRCMDLICTTEGGGKMPETEVHFAERTGEQRAELCILRRALQTHMAQSPCFMAETAAETEAYLHRVETDGRRTFTAEKDGEVIAFLDISEDGENFSTEFENMWNICGAYCVPKHRGTNAMRGLLEHVKAALKAENIPLLGVDCESINPTANRFWQKFFRPYTCSVTRRIEI